jgi:putative colanic acid biosynthesis acetyltransferase WcaF
MDGREENRAARDERPEPPAARVDLSAYELARHDPGAPLAVRVLWYLTNAIVFDSWLLPLYAPKRRILAWFGARVGRNVVIKPRVNVKYPWKLRIGDHAWIGEGVWIDNVAAVEIGAHVCLSQAVYVCTGNHDWSDARFRLRAEPVTIGDRAWIGAASVLCPGVRIGEGSVTSAGSVVATDTEPWMVYGGNPARALRARKIAEAEGKEPAVR